MVDSVLSPLAPPGWEKEARVEDGTPSRQHHHTHYTTHRLGDGRLDDGGHPAGLGSLGGADGTKRRRRGCGDGRESRHLFIHLIFFYLSD